MIATLSLILLSTGGFDGSAPSSLGVDTRPAEVAVERSLQNLFAALRSNDAEKFRAEFNESALLRRGRRAASSEAEARLIAQLVEVSVLLDETFRDLREREWGAPELAYLSAGDDPDSAFAIVRSRDAFDGAWYLQLWYERAESRWSIADFQGFGALMPASGLLVYGLRGQLPEGPLQRFLMAVDEVVERLERGDNEGARASLDDARVEGLPPAFAEIRAQLVGLAHYGAGDFPAARAATEAALRLRPDNPRVELLHASALLAEGQPQLALAAIDHYGGLVGPDAEFAVTRGGALEVLGRGEEAEAQYARGLGGRPSGIDCLLGWGRVLPAERASEMQVAYRTLADPRWFATFAADWLDAGRMEMVQALIAEQRALIPGDPNADFWEAELSLRLGAVEQAEALFLSAAAGLDGEAAQAESERRYLELCLARNASLEGLERAVDRGRAFDYLAQSLLDGADLEALEQLLASQAAAAPDERWLSYYRGRLAQEQGSFEAALKHFETGLFGVFPGATRDVYRWNTVDLLCRLERGLEAYRRIGPRSQTFGQLARCAVERGDAPLLAGLLEARANDAPEDPRLPFVEGCRRYIEGDYAGALRTLEPVAARLPENPALAVLIEAALIESALRVEAPDLALRTARQSTLRDGDPWFEIVVHVALEEYAAARERLKRWLELERDPALLYADERLGPVLSTHSAFAGFRGVHPPPEAAVQ